MVARYSGEWKTVKLGELGKVRMCRRIFQSQTKPYGQVPFFKIGTFDGEADAYITRELYEEYKRLYPYPKKGHVLLSAAGTIGRTFLFDGRDAYYQDSNIVWLDVNPEEVDGRYLMYFYQTYPWRNLEGTTIRRLYNSIILDTVINLPPMDEQIAIAETLSALDHHLANLSELIAKKKAIRQGALEELMTGRTRLSGFTGDWKTVKLGDITNYAKTKQVQPNKIPDGALIVEMEDIEQEGTCKLLAKHYDRCPKSAKNKFYPGDVLYGKMRTYLRKIWLADEEGYCSTEIVPFRGNDGIETKYLMYVMIAPEIVKQTIHMSYGMDMPRFGTNEALNLLVPLPPMEEQIAIAETLDSLDSEISALTSQSAKLSAIRNSAINNLLSGNIRLAR